MIFGCRNSSCYMTSKKGWIWCLTKKWLHLTSDFKAFLTSIPAPFKGWSKGDSVWYNLPEPRTIHLVAPLRVSSNVPLIFWVQRATGWTHKGNIKDRFQTKSIAADFCLSGYACRTHCAETKAFSLDFAFFGASWIFFVTSWLIFKKFFGGSILYLSWDPPQESLAKPSRGPQFLIKVLLLSQVASTICSRKFEGDFS